MADPKLTRLADQVAARYGIPKNLFRALIRQESGWNPRAKSPAGAAGLVQLMPATARGLGVTDPFDPQQSLDGGARYLRDQYKRFGKWDLALSAYNSGPGGAESAGRVEGFPETQNYVKAILGSLAGAGFDQQAGQRAAGAGFGRSVTVPPVPPPARLSDATRNLIFDDDPDLAATLGRIAAGRSPAPTVRPGRSGGALRQIEKQFGAGAGQAVKFEAGMLPKTGDQTADSILRIAHSQIGKPYVWGGESPKEGGFDCSGLIDWAYRQAGVKLPPGRLTTYSMMKLGQSVKGQQLRPGDWVITNGGKHVVMYVGAGKVIAAPRRGANVQYQALDRFKGQIVDVRRVL